MHDIRQFNNAGTVTVNGSEQPVWRLAERK
jgi:hypothetical protein